MGGCQSTEDLAREAKAKAGKKFLDSYTVSRQLGVGRFSVVREGTERATGDTYAIKILNKNKLTEFYETKLKDEIEVLSVLRHDNIIRLREVVEEPKFYYLVLEKMQGGELFDRIVRKKFYTELDVRNVCKMMLNAIAYCHEHSIVHRDVKPENVLLSSKSKEAVVKLADFGLATRCTEANTLTTQCGTPAYVAPEILEGVQYGARVDLWSMGVLTFVLLGGYPPFYEEDRDDLYARIRAGEYEFHEEYWGRISDEAKTFVSKLLVVDPKLRYSAKSALHVDAWMQKEDSKLAEQAIGKSRTKSNLYRQPSLGHYASTTSLYSMASMVYE